MKIPPFNLRVKVHGGIGKKSFLEIGKVIKNDLDKNLLELCDKKLEDFDKVLEFGCGCGRVLLHVNPKKSQFYGADIDKKMISWCKKNLKLVDFHTNGEFGFSKYDSDYFDIIYCISVFTHMDEYSQLRWLGELERKLKPNGFLLLSLTSYENLKKTKHIEMADKLGILKNGFVFCKVRSPLKRLILGDNTTNIAYYTKDYIFKNFGRFFKIVKYVDNGIANNQDLIILQKVIKK